MPSGLGTCRTTLATFGARRDEHSTLTIAAPSSADDRSDQAASAPEAVRDQNLKLVRGGLRAEFDPTADLWSDCHSM